MRFPGTRTERTSLLATVIGCIAGVVGTLFGIYAYFWPAAQPAAPATAPTQTAQVVDGQLRAQGLRTAAISFRAISADYVVVQTSREWQAAEALFQKGEALYSTQKYGEAATCFDQAGRAFNDVYAAAQAKEGHALSDTSANDKKLKAYIADLDKQIGELEQQKIRSSPLEAGVFENAATREIDEQLRNLRSVKTDAQRKLVQTLGN